MIQQTLTSSMSVADLVPKAATRLPDQDRSGNAFGEALAGAQTVHDQRSAQTTAARDDRQVERSGSPTRVRNDDAQTREPEATDDRAPASHDGIDRADRPGGDDRSTSAAGGEGQSTTAEVRDADPGDGSTRSEGTDHASDAPVAEHDVAAAAGSAADAATRPTAVAVAASPVATNVDALLVPTTTMSTDVAATAAVDAAIRMTIAADDGADAAAAPATVAATDAGSDADGALVPATTTATTAEVDVDGPAVPAATKLAAVAAVDAGGAEVVPTQGAEDAAAGDETTGPTRPVSSVPVQQSGPTPARRASDAPTVVAADTVDSQPVATSAQPVLQAVAVASASGDEVDAGAAQLVQAVAVASADDDAGAAPAAPTAATASAVAVAATATDADGEDAVAAQAPGDEVLVDPEQQSPATLRAAQQQAPTVAVAQQAQARADRGVPAEAPAASTAEPAADADAAIAPTSTTGPVRVDPAASARLRGEAALGAGVQERIDHMAEQLATRLRLSQAAGGSQVQMSLKPRELGEVLVQMSVRDGVVAATVLVERADTLRTMQTNIEDLKRSLEQQGLSIQEFSVDVRGDSGAGGANARTASELGRDATRTSGGSAATVAGAAAVSGASESDRRMREIDPDELHTGDVSVLA